MGLSDRYLEDFAVGPTFGSGSQRIDEDRIKSFAAEFDPRSMRNLSLEARLRAIEIANALLEEGYEEGKAIRIAIAKTKEWSERHG